MDTVEDSLLGSDGHNEPPLIHPLVARAFRLLDGSRMPWVLLRGEDDLFRPSGDVDILVAPSLLPALDELLKGAGVHRVRAPGHGSHRFYFGLDSDGFWIKLDIVSEIAFGPYQQWPTPLAAECLERRVRKDSFWLPDPADRAWLQILHLVVDKGQVSAEKDRAARSAGAVARDQDAIAQLVDHWTGPGTASALLREVRSGSAAEVAPLAARIRSSWTRAAPARTTLLSTAGRLLRRISPRLTGSTHRGVVVAVVGPDGAGKTTLLQNIAAEFPLPSKYIHMGLWATSPRDPLLARLPGGRLATKVTRILRGALVARYHRRRNRLVLLDRAAYDALLPGSIDRSLGGRISAGLALRIAPVPDVLLVLDAPGEVMFRRKGEHSAKILETWRVAYRELAERVPNAWILDAAQSQNHVRRQAAWIVWRCAIGELVAHTGLAQQDSPGDAR